MANWCSNTVVFECSGETLREIVALFHELSLKEKKEERGQLPPFISGQRGFLFDIHWNGSVLLYSTRWCPNLEIMQAVADYFKAGFTCTYEELGNLIYGQAKYKHGVLTDISLDLHEFSGYHYHEDRDVYLFEGREYENDYEILEILLERKKQQQANTDYSKN